MEFLFKQIRPKWKATVEILTIEERHIKSLKRWMKFDENRVSPREIRGLILNF
jgi:hypothetical protein